MYFQAIETAKTAQSQLTAQYSLSWVPGGWRKEQKTKERKGGLHFSTMRALARREGRCNSPAIGLLDFSEEMCEPLLATLAPSWEKVFSMHLPSALRRYCGDVTNAVHAVLESFKREAEHLGEGPRLGFLPQLKAALLRISRLSCDKVLELPSAKWTIVANVCQLFMECCGHTFCKWAE